MQSPKFFNSKKSQVPVPESNTNSSQSTKSNISSDSKIFTIVSQSTNSCVTLPLSISSAGSAKLLIDTGSDISLLKIDHADDDALVYTDNKIALKGITPKVISSIGVSIGKIQIQNTLIQHPFHLVPEDFPISVHGILGRDFFLQYGAIVDYKQNNLFFEVGPAKIQLSLSCPNEVAIPARSECIVNFPVTFNDSMLCLQKEIKPGLLVGNTIVQPQNGICKISVINSSENSMTLASNDVSFEKLENYHVISFVNTNSANRLKLLHNELDTEHMNQEEKHSILQICREFNDFFLR